VEVPQVDWPIRKHMCGTNRLITHVFRLLTLRDSCRSAVTTPESDVGRSSGVPTPKVLRSC
jgi:hypothetical protein